MNQINFLPPAYQAIQAARPRRVIEMLLLAGAVAAMGVWYFVEHNRLTATGHYVATVESEAEAVHRQALEVNRYESMRQTLTRRAAIHQELAVPISDTQVMATLADLMPKSLSLKSLSMVSRRPTSEVARAEGSGTSAPIKAARRTEPDMLIIIVEGYAADDLQIAEFVEHLSAHPLFTTVKLGFSRNAEGAMRAREFRVEAELPLDRKYLSRPMAIGSERHEP